MNNEGTTVALYRTNGSSVKVHRAGCSMLSVANLKRGMVPLDAEDVEDMRERGYKITECRCTK